MDYKINIKVGKSEKDLVFSSFGKFNTGFFGVSSDMDIKRIITGFLHDSYCIKIKSSKKKYVIQKLRTIFDLSAININLKLFEKAQLNSQRILPDYWQTVHYFDADKFGNKIFYDMDGQAWRVMQYLPGKIRIYNHFNQIRKKKKETAYSLGCAIAIFGRILSEIPLNKWKKPLPNFHNARYHYNYIENILENRNVVLSLSYDTSQKVKCDKTFMNRYSGRINILITKIKERKYLLNVDNMLEKTIAHGDLKINNAVFIKDDNRKENCVSLIDLDTIQKGSILDDLSDALRSAGNIAGEEPESLDLVKINIEVVRGITEGYLDKMRYYFGSAKTKILKRNIASGYKKFLYMQAIRFLADSLVGNRYFRLINNESEDLNLYRAEVQIKALEEVEKIEDKI